MFRRNDPLMPAPALAFDHLKRETLGWHLAVNLGHIKAVINIVPCTTT